MSRSTPLLASEKAQTETQLVRFFVDGKLKNPLNGSWGGWRKHWRIARDWRERTTMALLIAMASPPRMYGFRSAESPKRATFTAHTGAPWDSDAIPGAIKPIRDALVDSRLIHSDALDSGHEFVYQQVVDRARRGVDVTVEAL